ncbi:hypothetical protein O0L34_g7718 [Tuta absoluta]|nr:hypothetical protein O0L34_g7718 [Tuta absoluta]
MIAKLAVILFASSCLAFPRPDEEQGPRPDKVAVPTVPRISNYIPDGIADGQLHVPVQSQGSSGEGDKDLNTANSDWVVYRSYYRPTTYYTTYSHYTPYIHSTWSHDVHHDIHHW